jgi:hypothetical protein
MGVPILLLKLAAGLTALFLFGKFLGHLFGLDGFINKDREKQHRHLARKF